MIAQKLFKIGGKYYITGDDWGKKLQRLMAACKIQLLCETFVLTDVFKSAPCMKQKFNLMSPPAQHEQLYVSQL